MKGCGSGNRGKAVKGDRQHSSGRNGEMEGREDRLAVTDLEGTDLEGTDWRDRLEELTGGNQLEELTAGN